MLRIAFCWVILWIGCLVWLDRVVSQTLESEQQRKTYRERREREVQQRSETLFQGKPPAGAATIIGRSVINSISNKGFGNTIALLEIARKPDICNEIGFDKEQAVTLKTARDMVHAQIFTNAPKYVQRFKAMTEADHKSIQEDLEKDIQRITDHVETLTTPEQKKNVQKLVFQSMGGLNSPMINLDTMSSLNLTDEQKKKAETTFKEMERERIAQMEEGLKLIEKAISLGGINMSPEDRAKIEAEGKALEARILATGKMLGDKLRIHLTDEQRELEKKLLANRPKYLPPLPRQLRGNFTDQSSPNLNSWIPGQGTPQDRSEEKKRRRPFPTRETD
jgi:Spy/CpxP family protein refolding chaperone